MEGSSREKRRGEQIRSDFIKKLVGKRLIWYYLAICASGAANSSEKGNLYIYKIENGALVLKKTITGLNELSWTFTAWNGDYTHTYKIYGQIKFITNDILLIPMQRTHVVYPNTYYYQTFLKYARSGEKSNVIFSIC